MSNIVISIVILVNVNKTSLDVKSAVIIPVLVCWFHSTSDTFSLWGSMGKAKLHLAHLFSFLKTSNFSIVKVLLQL